MERRIAVVQHGDYREALRLMAAGASEPYFGMFYTLEVLRGLLDPHPHLVVSLNPAEAYREQAGNATLVGIPFPARPPVPGGGILADWAWSRRILACVEEFRPTHFLLRTGGSIASRTLRWSTRRGLDTMAVFAGSFDGPGWFYRRAMSRTARLLNHGSVFLVGNHRMPATRSMIERGLRPDKAVAYDWPGARHPRNHVSKMLQPGDPVRLVYCGNVLRNKGVGDAVEAVALLRGAGFPATLTVVGDGPDIAAIRSAAAGLPDGAVGFTGRVSNDEAFERMRAAALVCVPSRHEFPEGLPLTLTEALAGRTPVIASDHPMHVGAFRDGEGVRFFPAGDARAMADLIRTVAGCPETYRRLSETTADAFARIECPTSFGDLVDRWRKTFA